MTVPVGLWPFDPRHIEWFLLAAARLGGLLALAPPFNHPRVPIHARVGLGFALVGLAWSAIATAPPPAAADAVELALRVAGELAVGLLLGFIAHLITAAATFAAELMGVQMGFGFAAVFDPTQGNQVTVLTHLFDMLVILLFLTLDGHHLVVAAAVESFRVVPLGGWWFSPELLESVLPLASRMFTLGLALAGPTLGALFIANLILVLLARSIPQMNILLVGFPLMITVGLLVFLLNLDLMGSLIGGEIRQMEAHFVGLLRSLSHGR
ncbi:MAG: flagellar biosynthetic protein FliR [Candidatus Rokubacteria bacterium]|nr:flagellar biosynthetic protein FliR [Candidatus Rokubacteria bacterium]